MKVIRGEGGKLYPYKNEIDANNYSKRNAKIQAKIIEATILMEIIKALEHISQQIFELK